MTDAATLLTELERLHHRQADLRSYELHLAERGEDDPASDTWKTAAIVAASAEADFQAALVRNWPALAAFLREAVSPWRLAGEKQVQVHEALQDSAFRAGALAGWNAQFASDPNATINRITHYEKGALAIIHEKRAGEKECLPTPPAAGGKNAE